mmetsp:Transcript_49584/g.82560  ORF Transcript_49584/g.82560 Transcript_49584/m.82560 type:complete len:429 (-) Transcript_49584:148-1434(-)
MTTIAWRAVVVLLTIGSVYGHVPYWRRKHSRKSHPNRLMNNLNSNRELARNFQAMKGKRSVAARRTTYGGDFDEYYNGVYGDEEQDVHARAYDALLEAQRELEELEWRTRARASLDMDIDTLDGTGLLSGEKKDGHKPGKLTGVRKRAATLTDKWKCGLKAIHGPSRPSVPSFLRKKTGTGTSAMHVPEDDGTADAAGQKVLKEAYFDPEHGFMVKMNEEVFSAYFNLITSVVFPPGLKGYDKIYKTVKSKQEEFAKQLLKALKEENDAITKAAKDTMSKKARTWFWNNKVAAGATAVKLVPVVGQIAGIAISMVRKAPDALKWAEEGKKFVKKKLSETPEKGYEVAASSMDEAEAEDRAAPWPYTAYIVANAHCLTHPTDDDCPLTGDASAEHIKKARYEELSECRSDDGTHEPHELSMTDSSLFTR